MTDDACLVQIYQPEDRRIALCDGFTIGRHDTCDLVLEQQAVSREHARITRDANVWRIADLATPNGTTVNDQAIASRVLRDGDRVDIGSVIFRALVGRELGVRAHAAYLEAREVDGLTDVMARRPLIAHIARERARSALVMLDIDHMKALNDRDGHLAGDRILRALGKLLRQHVASPAVVGRYGGEEFVVVLPDHTLDMAAAVAEHLRATVAAQLPITISLGVAAPHPDDAERELERRADLALGQAKCGGRDRVAS